MLREFRANVAKSFDKNLASNIFIAAAMF